MKYKYSALLNFYIEGISPPFKPAVSTLTFVIPVR